MKPRHLPSSPCHVVMFQRHPLEGQHSLERLFADVRDALPADVLVTTLILPFPSRRVVNRLRNILFVRRHRGGVNHVTGDVQYVALALPGRSTILTIPDLVSLRRLTGWRRFLLSLLWYRLPVWRAGCVTVISEWTREELSSLLPSSKSKIQVIHAPVSPGFRASPLPHRDRPVVLQVGTGRNKNLGRLVEALTGLEIHLRVVGDLNQQQREQLSARAIEFSQVRGLADDMMAAEYAMCDLVVFASTYEGFGLPILEAQASGRPVITSAAASMPEVAGDGALLVDPFDVASIRGAVCSLVNDIGLQQVLVERGLENVARFSAQGVAAAYARIYRGLQRPDETTGW